MRKKMRLLLVLIALLLNAVYGFSDLFLRNLGGIIEKLGSLFGLDEELVQMFGAVFRQIGEAEIVHSLWGFLLVFLVVVLYVLPQFAGYMGWIVRPVYRVVKWACVPLMIVAVVVTVAEASVNTVSFGWVVKSLVDLVKAGAI